MTRIKGVSAVKAMLEKQGLKEATREAANTWFSESQRHLTEAAENRAGIDSEGRAGRKASSLHKITKSAYAPYWDDERDAWVFGYTHRAAIFHEYGAEPHEIRARKAKMLAFEWPDAPAAVKEQFKHTEGDLVFFKSIQHPGVPAIGFVRYGRARAQRALEDAGYTSASFETGGEEE